MFRCFQTYCTFADVNYGALAHLARARHWQCRGGEFESRMLHVILSDSHWRFLVLRVAFFVSIRMFFLFLLFNSLYLT